MQPLELWGGHECTVNRVADGFHDQTRRTGHHERLSDLDRFADLGLKALRYPLLWERADPQGRGEPDWRWTDERLTRIRQLGMRPIAGLLHHGSGPACTNLLDKGFAHAFSAYAGGPALSMDRRLDPHQRAPDDGAVLRSLRPLVSASHGRDAVLDGVAQPDRRHAAGDAGDPPDPAGCA